MPIQKKRFLSPLLRGGEVIAVAMTEPDAGSATTDLATTAVPDGKGFPCSGHQVFPNHADQYLVRALQPGESAASPVMIRRGARATVDNVESSCRMPVGVALFR